MPRKMARPAVSTAVWARGMAAAVSTPRRYCRKAVIARIFMPDRKPSGESRINGSVWIEDRPACGRPAVLRQVGMCADGALVSMKDD
jgi:hypothetical protein